jgi:NAD+ synthase
MTSSLTLCLAPLNPTVGDLQGNVHLIAAACRETGADLIVTPELSICGYPSEDLILKPAFVSDCMAAVQALAAELAHGPAVLVGTPWAVAGQTYNAIVLLHEGRVEAVRFKHDLPNYGVFDEKRVFAAGPLPDPIAWCGHRLGVMVCEDLWSPAVAAHLKAQGADQLIVANASPYRRGVADLRRTHARARVAETSLPLVYVNQLGGQDEVVFDGDAFALDAAGRMLAAGEAFSGQTVNIPSPHDGMHTQHSSAAEDGVMLDRHAITLALHDYVTKCGFPGVVLGLSGGVDSALTLALAVEALGADRVRAVMMPSLYTSAESLADAAAQAALQGAHYDVVPIDPVVEALTAQLAPVIGVPEGLTAENLQSRARAVILMGISNTTGAMVLTTGNKSELAVGYATLYGDMCGGYNPLKDLYKTEVYALAASFADVIPARVLTRAPSAELRPDQTDQDSLPPYDILDAILRGLIDEDRAAADLMADGFDVATVTRIERLVRAAEYKRFQAPPGVKLGPRAFGRDRRYPLVNAYLTTGH